jgi:hypothetical protein
MGSGVHRGLGCDLAEVLEKSVVSVRPLLEASEDLVERSHVLQKNANQLSRKVRQLVELSRQVCNRRVPQ